MLGHFFISIFNSTDKVLAIKKADAAKKEQETELSNEVSTEPTYESNEINGKFKIMADFSDELNDPSSPMYQEMSSDIIRGIEELLEQDDQMKEQADYTVTILGFKYAILFNN